MSAPRVVGDFLRGGDVAEALAHLAPGLVQHEAMGQHRLERGGAAGADRLQQAGLEPAAMLVGAFQVEIGGPGQAAILEGEAVGGAAFEPDVDDVHDLLVIGRVAVRAEEAGGGRGEPGIRALGGEGLRMTRATTAGSRSGSPEARWTKTGIGTPQARWRLMHQSGRPATMLPMRLRPWGGMNWVASMASSARSRMRSGPSMRMNHCGVAR